MELSIFDLIECMVCAKLRTSKRLHQVAETSSGETRAQRSSYNGF